MDIVSLVSKRSTCMRRHVGACLVRNKRILATGYNGTPTGIPHCIEGGCMRERLNIPSGERQELCNGLHAEQNVIIQAALHGTSTEGSTLYVTNKPCIVCAKMLINAGIKEERGNMKNYRHGDLALIGVRALPDGLKESDSKILMTGSGGNHHTFDRGEFYPSTENNGFIIGYLVATDQTKLYHPDHGAAVEGKKLREAKIKAGIYECRKQQEDTHAGMKPVVD